MKVFNYFAALLLLLVMGSCTAPDVYASEVQLGDKVIVVPRMASDVYAGEVQLGDKLIVVPAGNVTKLCPYPDCRQGQHVTRIPKGTVLKVEGLMKVKYGNSTMKWFETTYKEKRGWISIYDTEQSK